jgi:hypothetical protein
VELYLHSPFLILTVVLPEPEGNKTCMPQERAHILDLDSYVIQLQIIVPLLRKLLRKIESQAHGTRTKCSGRRTVTYIVTCHAKCVW